jgi:hypothetical protein
MNMRSAFFGSMLAVGFAPSACMKTQNASPGAESSDAACVVASGANSGAATNSGSPVGSVPANSGAASSSGASVVAPTSGSGASGTTDDGAADAAGTTIGPGTTSDGGIPEAGPSIPVPSAGCGKAPTENIAQFNSHMIMSSNVNRQFFTYLPPNYDSKKPYPTIFEFHPCGGSGDPSSNVPIQNASKDAAILIAPQSQGQCYENQIRNSPDVTLFDDTLGYAEQNYCVDQSRVFAIGYSAGSWMSIILGCVRSQVIRAHAQVSGGLPMFIRPGVDCPGSVAALFIHDEEDPMNTILGGIAARDRVLRIDHCGSDTMPWAPAPCELYTSCKPDFPVVWCETMGQGHDRQDNLAPGAMWKFFSQF